MSSTMPENVLGAQALGKIILASIPRDASPQLKSPTEALVLAAHACMLAVGFKLTGLGEDHRIDASSDAQETQPLPSEWNAQSSSYSFQYSHDQSSMKFLLRIHKMGAKLVFNAMAVGDDKTHTFDVKIGDFTSESNFPAANLGQSRSGDDETKKLADLYISEGRLSDFGKLMRVSMLQKLIPSVRKEGYEETTETSPSDSRTRPRPPIIPGRDPERLTHDPLREDRDPPARPYPFDDPLAHPRRPGRPLPEPIPGFEDEFETLRPPRGIPGAGGFPRIGDRDLYPQGLGPHDPIRGGLGPGFGPGTGGGGMHPTFDDPLFAGQGHGGNGYDPQAPPGSRFDPVGPGMGGLHPRGSGMGGRPPNPFGGFGGNDFI